MKYTSCQRGYTGSVIGLIYGLEIELVLLTISEDINVYIHTTAVTQLPVLLPVLLLLALLPVVLPVGCNIPCPGENGTGFSLVNRSWRQDPNTRYRHCNAFTVNIAAAIHSGNLN